MTDAEAAKAGLEKVTDFVEDKGVDGARASEALSALATADDAAAQANLERERALAAVKIDKADVELIIKELEVDRAVADRELRVQGGDVVAVLRALTAAAKALSAAAGVVGRRPATTGAGPKSPSTMPRPGRTRRPPCLPVLGDLARADELQPRRPGRAPLPQTIPRADLVREVLELRVLEAHEWRALHVLDVVVDAPDDRIDGSFVALGGPVGLDAVSISIVVRAEVESSTTAAACVVVGA